MVPNGWERKPLVDIAEIRTGVAKGKKGLKDPIEVPYLRVANVQDGHIDLTEVKTIAIERHQLARYSLRAGDVLMTEGGDFDKLGRGDVWHGQIQPCLNQNHVFAVRVDSKILEPYYLAALSGSHYGKTYFLSCAKRSTNLASINSTQLKEFPVLIPPLPEQRKVAKILYTWDKAISTTERLIDNSKQQKKALMQQLLTGKKSLLDESGKPFEGEWEEVKLKSIAEMNSGGTPKSSIPEYYGGDIPWVSIADMTKHGKSISKTEKYLTQEGLNNSSARFYPKGTILYAMYASIGECSIAEVELSSSQAILGIRPTDKLSNDYLYYFLTNLKSKITLMGQQGTQSNLNAGMVKDFRINLPPKTEQLKIASVLTNADKEIDLLKKQLADLKKEKKALMQQLLTGKRRVKVDDKEVA
ncbi:MULTISPECIES: restriction endonuclease subunit S [unclassified Pseudoalteromonas]|uniref:restriction endonuclease subunit S n=1 Tax=Pseudoalteromonas sp. RB2-MNA-CIBAN-0110 TaxID=3140439 RepID=UPI00040DD705|nr:restriction endonuclease subunit S [Pseudoalteromonas sp. TB13]